VLRSRPFGEVSLINIPCSWGFSSGNFWLENQYSASHKAQKRIGKKENRQNPKQMVKAKLNRKKNTKKLTPSDSQEGKKPKKKRERERENQKESNQINEKSHKWKQTLKTKLEKHKIKRNSNTESKLKEAKKT